MAVGNQQKWDCDNLTGPPRLGPDPKWDRRNALNLICRLVLEAAHQALGYKTPYQFYHHWLNPNETGEGGLVRYLLTPYMLLTWVGNNW